MWRAAWNVFDPDLKVESCPGCPPMTEAIKGGLYLVGGARQLLERVCKQRKATGFCRAAVGRFKDRSSDTHGTLSIVYQHAFVAAEGDKVEENALSGVGSVHEETRKIVEPVVIVENDI